MKVALLGSLLLGASWMALPSEAAQSSEKSCAPAGGLSFLCGMDKPEDLATLPGDRWIVASGMSSKSGLHLIDTRTKAWERWIAPVAAAPKAPFDACPAQPAPDEFQAHGISVRDGVPGHATLYAVNHGGREPVEDTVHGRGHETIEVFDVAMAGKKPALTWLGCVPLPGTLMANSVVSGPDGTIFATVIVEPPRSIPDIFKDLPTGAVYRWKPGMKSFERMAGTELAGNNGIEVSPDGKTLYVASLRGVTSFTNTIPAKRLASVEIKDSLSDNIHRVNGRLVVSGQKAAACPPAAVPWTCFGGYFAYDVNPRTLAVTKIADGAPNAAFSGVSTAIPVGKTLWLGSYTGDRVAYRPLP